MHPPPPKYQLTALNYIPPPASDTHTHHPRPHLWFIFWVNRYNTQPFPCRLLMDCTALDWTGLDSEILLLQYPQRARSGSREMQEQTEKRPNTRCGRGLQNGDMKEARRTRTRRRKRGRQNKVGAGSRTKRRMNRLDERVCFCFIMLCAFVFAFCLFVLVLVLARGDS
ncbi:hypothetical protein DFP73DRAFT_566178 [Morchella snyderi]|nr:hypothetical protein DFP73DRAFT_566178 [Morchella snyderi]